MSLFVKICGISDVGSAEVAADAGADAVGFVFAESPRRVTPREAAAIAGYLPSDVLKVAVFRRPSRAEIEKVIETFTPDLIQADHSSMEGSVEFPTLPVYRDGAGGDPGGTRFLYEGPVSGAGRIVDLDRAAEMAGRGEMILAGGLRPENVALVISRVRPFGVDVSSGVESAPGSKDDTLIRSFVAAARVAAERTVRI